MPKVTRLKDYNTGHDSCPPVPLVTASENVIINGKGVGRINDLYDGHSCDDHSWHQDYIADGSNNVFINNRKVGRVGDKVEIGGNVRDGSDNVIIN